MQYFFQFRLFLTQQSPPSKLHSGVLNSSSQYLSWYQDGFSAIASQMAGAAVGGAAAVVGAAVVGAAVVGAAVVATDPPQAVGAARSIQLKLFVFQFIISYQYVPAIHQLLLPTWLYLAK